MGGGGGNGGGIILLVAWLALDRLSESIMLVVTDVFNMPVRSLVVFVYVLWLFQMNEFVSSEADTCIHAHALNQVHMHSSCKIKKKMTTYFVVSSGMAVLRVNL